MRYSMKTLSAVVIALVSVVGIHSAFAVDLPICDVKKHGQAVGKSLITVTEIAGVKTASITVKSVAKDCKLQVGMASYEKFDEVIRNQIVHNIDFGGFLNPGEEKTLSVIVPPCASQIDVYQGEAITDYFSDFYCPGYPSNCRLVTALHTNCSNASAGGPCTGGVNGTVNTSVPYCSRKPPVCSAGSTYSSGLECSAAPKTITLDGSQSSGLGLTYNWSTTCPGATFNPSAQEVKPTFTLSTLAAVGSSVSCQVNLTVTDRYGLSSNCSSAVLGETCQGDCAGTVNGTAVRDECGVCEGDGSTCQSCETTNIEGTQIAIDVNLAALKTRVSRLVKLTENAMAKAKIQGREASKLRAKNQELLKSASALYTAGWESIYSTVPATVLSCPQTNACINVSIAGAKTNLEEHAIKLFNVAKDAHATLRSTTSKLSETMKKKLNKKGKTVINEAKERLASEQSLIASIPSSTSSCN